MHNNTDMDIRQFAHQSLDRLFDFTTNLSEDRGHASRCIEADHNINRVCGKFHVNSCADTSISQVGEEVPLSFLMLARTGSRVIIQPWIGRATRTNLRGVTSTSFLPLVTSLMTKAPFAR